MEEKGMKPKIFEIKGKKYRRSCNPLQEGDEVTCICPDDFPDKRSDIKTRYGDKGIVHLHWDRVEFPQHKEEFVYWSKFFAKLTEI